MAEQDAPAVQISKQALADYLREKLAPEDLIKASALIATYTAACVRAKAPTVPSKPRDTRPSIFDDPPSIFDVLTRGLNELRRSS